MLCVCGATTTVIDSRSTEANAVRRRRKCNVCGSRWTTHEINLHQATLVEEAYTAIKKQVELRQQIETLTQQIDARMEAVQGMRFPKLATPYKHKKVNNDSTR